MLCLAVYLPGIMAIPPIDRDEARFAQASRQMFEAAALPPHERRDDFHDGGWAVPKVQDRPRLNKPPLIYWLQAASAWLLTAGDPLKDHIGMYRIPSVLGAIAAVMLTWRLARRMVDPRPAWLAAALLAVAPVVVIDAHQARADQVLLATVLATQACLWRIWKQTACLSPPRTCTRWAMAFWLCLGAAVLAKGPIGPMIAALTILVLCIARRQWAWTAALRPLPGVLILAAVIFPWVAMVAGNVGWANYLSIIYDETIGRGVSTREGHWGPPGYHTLLLAVLFWPGSLLTARALARAWRLARATNNVRSASPEPASPRIPAIQTRLASFARSRFAGRDAEVFCLAWIIPSWIVFELLNTKLPHYTLPMYPPIAILTARAILAHRESGPGATFSAADRLGFVAWWMIGLAISAATTAAIVVLAFIPQDSEPGRTPILAAITLSLATLAAVWRIRPTTKPQVAPRRLVVMVLAWVAVSGLFLTCPPPERFFAALDGAQKLILKRVRHKYRVVPLGACGQERHRSPDQFLDMAHILDRLCRQVVPAARPAGCALPAF
ncbi:MAG TPA: glycosyltransferase family 39 protein, partial [Phycisphaerales bacterium]|nr:glycosyltransferase family 39 protein [Phycisphaerales bacterium]